MPSSTLMIDSGLAAVQKITQNLTRLTTSDDPAKQKINEQFLNNFLYSDQLVKVLGIHDTLFDDPCRVPSEELHSGRSILGDAVLQLQPLAARRRPSAAAELHNLLRQPYLKELIAAYDDVCNCRFEPDLAGAMWPPGVLNSGDYDELSNVTDDSNQHSMEGGFPGSMSGLRGGWGGFDLPGNAGSRPVHNSQPALCDLPRQIGIRKERNESLGLTVVRRNIKEGHQVRSQIVVERIFAGSVIERQGLLSVGDVILEVNNEAIQTPEALLRILKQVPVGTITMKILPGNSRHGKTSSESLVQCYMRPFFNYEPDRDTLLPTGNVGLPFQAGDIIEIVSKEDVNFWQARRYDSPNSQAGLIPSPILEERRKAFCRSAASEAHNHVKKKGTKTVLFKAMDASGIFSRSEVWTYEEVVKVPPSQVTCLVLVGASHIGKKSLKKALCGFDSGKFAYPMIDTTAPLKGNQRDYFHHVSRSKMESDIREAEYAEWSEVNGYLNGVRFASIREIIDRGRTAVIDCQVRSIPNIRRPELNPHIVFIAAPAVEVLLGMQSKGLKSGVITSKLSDLDLKEIVSQSTRFERHYRHIYHTAMLNDNFAQTTQKLASLVRSLEHKPGWIPASWEIDRVPLLPPLPLENMTPPVGQSRYSKRNSNRNSGTATGSLLRPATSRMANTRLTDVQPTSSPEYETVTPYAQLDYPAPSPEALTARSPEKCDTDRDSYNYAEIDHTKRAVTPPLPSRQEDLLAPHFVESKLRPFRVSVDLDEANRPAQPPTSESSSGSESESETGSGSPGSSEEQRPPPAATPLESKVPPVPLAKPLIPAKARPPIPKNKPKILPKPRPPVSKPEPTLPPPPVPAGYPLTSSVPKPSPPVPAGYPLTSSVPKPSPPVPAGYPLTSSVPKPSPPVPAGYPLTSSVPKPSPPVPAGFPLTSSVPKPPPTSRPPPPPIPSASLKPAAAVDNSGDYTSDSSDDSSDSGSSSGSPEDFEQHPARSAAPAAESGQYIDSMDGIVI